jgi:hypothetical protein
MAAPAVRVEGVERLTKTLDQAAADLDDLSAVGDDLERSLLPQIVARTPRRTGRLRGSVRAKATKSGVEFGSAVVYAAPIHWGWPARHIAAQRFVWDVVTGQTDAVVAKYQKGADRVLAKVEGA